MANKPNANNGGIWSLKDLKDRCYIEPETACWIWRMSFNHGVPNVTFRIDGKRQQMRGKRAAKCLEKRKVLGSEIECWGVVGCSVACVNPAHVIAGTPKERGEYISKHKLQTNVGSRLVAAKIGGMARRKLTQEQVDSIRESDETTVALARRFNVSRYAIYAVKIYKNWRGSAQNNSVFSWRPAA